MNRIKRVANIVIILFMFIILHNAIIYLLGNVFSIMRENNRDDVLKKSYENRIQILDYEKSLDNLKIYEGNSYVLAKTAIRDIYDFYEFVMISTDTKVNEGSAVVDEFGLVGLIDSSNKMTAKVKLLTGGVKLSVKIGEAFGILDEYNKKEELFVIHNINNYKKIEVGTEVYTSGLQNIDEGIYVGIVEKVEVAGVEQRVFVKPKRNYDNLNYLAYLF